jgi:hypothetical protein
MGTKILETRDEAAADHAETCLVLATIVSTKRTGWAAM